ncbi:hypothetical protein SEUCBS139899_006343 [Sporothrix eucalyptigena]|uniref:Zn(2)-C6 fungal-type domain-containing protein n=1 Tax=Sporothrix eucalyptigena TaxID=1812306 RepID=A0ABP0BY51_9PEZI
MSQPLLPRERGGPGANANADGTESSAASTTSTSTSSTRRRSRNGCLTCKRRKVRCNEQRPRCCHCQRLRYDCVWSESATVTTTEPEATSSSSSTAVDAPRSERAAISPASFDFAQSIVDGTLDLSSFQDIYFPPVSINDFSAPVFPLSSMQGTIQQPTQQQQQDWVMTLPTQSPEGHHSDGTHHESPEVRQDMPQNVPQNMSQDAPLAPVAPLDLPVDLPPILDPIENGPKCASVKALFQRMATASPMFRAALGAFAAIQTSSSSSTASTITRLTYKRYYDQAAQALAEQLDRMETGSKARPELPHILATIFFLTYINLLTGQLDMACANLEKAHRVLQVAGGVGALGPVEQRIVSWIRLLDARTASAGGTGHLVNDTSNIVYPLTPSTPETTDAAGDSPDINSPSSTISTSSSSQELIYEMLCQPGIVFFQEVQTLTVRITRIAHAHRSRGSVEDETEVMAIAGQILKDLAALYRRRPAIMDAVVEGRLLSEGAILAPSLTSAIVRSYQTYLANFYACYIHLHRVAHRHLARSQHVVTAMQKIKEMVHAMADDGHIMVNMLWPLFLWGSEEDDPEACRWILKTIRSLHHMVTNAIMAANVLQEIQTRQQEAGLRVDIRSVCLELFNTTFAIV